MWVLGVREKRCGPVLGRKCVDVRCEGGKVWVFGVRKEMCGC